VQDSNEEREQGQMVETAIEIGERELVSELANGAALKFALILFEKLLSERVCEAEKRCQ
jgi:hypothetical protein